LKLHGEEAPEEVVSPRTRVDRLKSVFMYLPKEDPEALASISTVVRTKLNGVWGITHYFDRVHRIFMARFWA
jgi:hypothetical protein